MSCRFPDPMSTASNSVIARGHLFLVYSLCKNFFQNHGFSSVKREAVVRGNSNWSYGAIAMWSDGKVEMGGKYFSSHHKLQCLPPGDPKNPCVSHVKKGGPGKRQLIHSGEANSVSRSVISINADRLSVINLN